MAIPTTPELGRAEVRPEPWVESLPTQLGFYWWAMAGEPWRLVEIRTHGDGALRAYDVETYRFYGRSLASWAATLRIGRWVGPLKRPEVRA